uniref:Structure-specific endonuclease subunit SLX1 homolog n=1 Tax=Chenopodium quinoa TaxID=63459 RepID=A0A803MW56_CHEQI
MGKLLAELSERRKKRPWEMVLCIHGFPTNVAALQFEWAWQHPRESVAVREAAAGFKTLGGLANKIKLALTMLTLHSWQSLNLTVSFFSTKYMKHAAGCPSLPHQMKLHFCSIDELPCYGDSDQTHGCDDDDDNFDSNDGEVSASCSDDRIESSADVSMEMIPSSIHVQSCTSQNSSDSILAGDFIGIVGSLESDSSSMMSAPEEQPLHQLPVDVSGFTLNTSNEHLRPCEETWIEDERTSFPDLAEHIQPFCGIYASDNELFPILEEKQSSCDLPADAPFPTGNDFDECSRYGNEFWPKELRGSSPEIEEHIQPFEQAGPSETYPSSMVDFVAVMEDVTKKDKITCIVIDDITEQQCQPIRVQSPIRNANTVRPFSNEGIEVIELCTPSPDIITRGSKKRRAVNEFPSFIDLTGSPSFIQL